MVSLQLYSRGEAKLYMERLFNQISEKKYIDAQHTSIMLKNCLLKYYLTRNIECDNIYNIFFEFDFLLKNCNGSSKQNTLFDFLKRIRNMSQLSVADPIQRLRQIYDDLRYAYLHMSHDNVETIIDCFDEIRDLYPRMKEIGGSVLNYYNIACKIIGECEAGIVDITFSTEKIIPKTVVANQKTNFQRLFSAMQSIFSPPVLLELSPEDVSKYVRGGVSIKELSKASGHREEELQAMLTQIDMSGIIEEGTEEDD